MKVFTIKLKQREIVVEALIYFIRLLQICSVLFAARLIVSGVLFLLGPALFDIDYAINSSIAFIAVYFFVLLKLTAEFWIVFSLANVKLLRFDVLSNVLAWSAIFFSLVHLAYLYFGSSMSDVLDSISRDNIKTIILVLKYLCVRKMLLSFSNAKDQLP